MIHKRQTVLVVPLFVEQHVWPVVPLAESFGAEKTQSTGIASIFCL